MNRKTSLLLGYARRMEEIARLATEMRDISAAYEREFKVAMGVTELADVLTQSKLAKLATELRDSVHPLPREQDPEEQREQSVAPGAALGLVPAPGWLEDVATGYGDTAPLASRPRPAAHRCERDDACRMDTACPHFGPCSALDPDGAF